MTDDRTTSPSGVVRLLGRSRDLAARPPRDGEQRLCDVVARWSLAANEAWLDGGIRRGDPFHQVSAATPGSVLAHELNHLTARGYVALGPFWVPARWHRCASTYRRVVRLVAEHVLATAPAAPGEFVPKAAAELEPLLALWPHVRAVPTTRELSIDALIRLRATPVHPLGFAAGCKFADGKPRSPAEFFFHDLDHARFKVREDLLARGVDVPDAYRDGTTWDAAHDRHRTVLPAVPRADVATAWRRPESRRALATHLLAAADATTDRNLAAAMRWLLFEMVHEKSLPLEREVLRRELAHDGHAAKLATKCARGFHGAATPGAAVVDRLDDARRRLARACATAAT